MKKYIGLIILCSGAIIPGILCMDKKKNFNNFSQEKITVKLPNAVIKLLHKHGKQFELLKKMT